MLWLRLSIVYANPNLAELDATKFIFIFLAMLYIITSDIMNFPEGWYAATPEESERLRTELILELVLGHIMYQKDFEVVAHRDGATDDILCKHLDQKDLYTVIHLTWSMKPEIDDRYPLVEVHGTFDDFLEYENRWLNI